MLLWAAYCSSGLVQNHSNQPQVILAAIEVDRLKGEYSKGLNINSNTNNENQDYKIDAVCGGVLVGGRRVKEGD
jgi:hypothetical protein